MTDENTTEQLDPGKQPMIDEIDRLQAELAKSRHEDFITVEEQARRNAQELADILHGPNTGALDQVGLQR